MRRLSSLLPSPAMLVALLALFVALGGSAYAVKAATAPAVELADGAVTGAKVGARTITAGNIDLPTPNIPKATTYTVRQTTVLGHAFAKDHQFQLLTSCLPGETVTGGGRTSNGRISLSESIPFTGSTEQRLGVLFHNTSGEPLTVEVTAFAIRASS